MPPEPQNKNNNILNQDPYKVGIDPVFKGTTTPPKPVVDQTAPASAYNVLANQQYVPNQPPISATLNPTPVTNLNPKSIVRTYKGDIASIIQTDHISSINIAIAENEKMRSQIKTEASEPTPSNGEYSKNKIIIFAGSILVIIGIVGIGIVIFLNGQKPEPTAQVQELPSIITAEFKTEVNFSQVSNNNLATAISNKLNDDQITVNNIENIYLTVATGTSRRLLTASEFVSRLGFKIPNLMARTLLPDFMIGTLAYGKNLPFVILKTSSFENTYAGMLQWEKDMEKDFKVLFRLPGYENIGTLLSELTPTTVKKFEDGVIVNKDVRLLRDSDNEIMLLYGIIDKETIIITVNETAFKEIVSRLNKEKGLKR